MVAFSITVAMGISGMDSIAMISLLFTRYAALVAPEVAEDGMSIGLCEVPYIILESIKY